MRFFFILTLLAFFNSVTFVSGNNELRKLSDFDACIGENKNNNVFVKLDEFQVQVMMPQWFDFAAEMYDTYRTGGHHAKKKINDWYFCEDCPMRYAIELSRRGISFNECTEIIESQLGL